MTRVAAIQMASGSNVLGNLQEAEKLIGQAAFEEAKLILLPENFALVGKRDADIYQQMESEGEGQIQDFLAEMSSKHGVLLVAGSVPLTTADPNKIRAASLVYDENGEMVARYDKIHLFDVGIPDSDENYHESETYEPGEAICCVETEIGKIGMSLCYDLRFPELYRQLSEMGAEILLVPAMFTATTGQAHWHTLLKARAIENQCYVIASAQGGYHINGRETYGHSMIIDPWGTTLDEVDTGSGYVIADIDLQKLHNLRERFPVLKHRRFLSQPGETS